MQKNSLLVVIILLSLFTFRLGFSKEPQNLDHIKTNLMRYYESGEYQKDQAKIIDQALQYLKTRLAQQKKSKIKKKLAIVLDIDETALSNYPSMVTLSFGGTMLEIDEEEGRGLDPVIEATLELYRYAKANNIAVFFVTGRREKFCSATRTNLISAGYREWDGLTCKPDNYHEKTAAIFKTEIRQQLENQGYDIILNIGDQKSDLVGGHADKTFKLPNPFYIVP